MRVRRKCVRCPLFCLPFFRPDVRKGHAIMKFLVFSDSHGQTANMTKIVERDRGEIDAVLHLGDGAKEVLSLRSRYPDLPFYAVLGNCDGFDYQDYGIRQELLLPVGDRKIFLCHGDRFFVQYGHDTLLRYAKQAGADAALYGHLHIASERYYPADETQPQDKPLLICSPGSISSPRDGLPSFGYLDVSDAGILFSVGRLEPSALRRRYTI